MKITLYKIGDDLAGKEIYNGEYRKVPLKELYDLIECRTVERLPMPNDAVEIWVDEEGRLNDDWQYNPLVSMMFQNAFRNEITTPGYDWRVAGNAVVIERTYDELEKYHNEE